MQAELPPRVTQQRAKKRWQISRRGGSPVSLLRFWPARPQFFHASNAFVLQAKIAARNPGKYNRFPCNGLVDSALAYRLTFITRPQGFSRRRVGFAFVAKRESFPFAHDFQSTGAISCANYQ